MFQVGDEVQVGTMEHLPWYKNRPMPGRVICVDAINHQKLTVLALIQEDTEVDNDMETLLQFNDEGKCMLATYGEGNLLASQFLEANLYHKVALPN